MVAAVALLAIGLAVPVLLRGRPGGSAPRLLIASNIAALVVAWVGLLAVVMTVSAAVSGAHVDNVVDLCRLFVSAAASGSTAATVVTAVFVAIVPGRAMWLVGRSWADQVRIRRALGPGRAQSLVVRARLGTVACTVGVLVPRIVVDAEQFDRLPAEHQRTVLAHERQHVRGRHLLVDLLARCLAAGLAPLPGARVAVAEVRRQLEAVADDAAVRQVGRRSVAAAIVDVACGPAPRVGALGAAGWAAWRVDRLLSPPERNGFMTAASVATVVLAIVLAVHVVAHPFHSLVDLPAHVWSVICCVV